MESVRRESGSGVAMDPQALDSRVFGGRRSGQRLAHGLLLGVLAVSLAACVVPINVDSRLDEGHGNARRVVVMPFRAQGAGVSDVAIELVAARVFSRLDADRVFDLISPVDVRVLLDHQPGSERSDIARAFGADAFLVGSVRRFEGRVRPDGMAQGPAWVAFDLELQSADGSRLWRGSYAERQRGFIEDLAGFGRAYDRGFRWVAPEQLASYGASELVRDLRQKIEELRRSASGETAPALEG